MSHNTFGSIFKFTTWGESHGKAIGCVVDGTPPMIELLEKDIQLWLDKRRPGQINTQAQEMNLIKLKYYPEFMRRKESNIQLEHLFLW